MQLFYYMIQLVKWKGHNAFLGPEKAASALSPDLLLANAEWILRVAERERERDLEGNRKVMDFVPSSLSISGPRPRKYSAKFYKSY